MVHEARVVMPMDLDPVRRFSIRGSSPQKQRARDASLQKGLARRAVRRLKTATAVKSSSKGMKPDDWRGFAAWWRTIDECLLQGLSEDELQRVWQVAWDFHHAVEYTEAWRKLLTALRERLRKAAPPEPLDYWKHSRIYVGESAARRDGW